MSALLIITLGLWCAGWLLRSGIKPFRAGNAHATHLAPDFNSGLSSAAFTTNHRGGEMSGQGFGAHAENLTPEVLAQQLSIIIPARNEEHNLPKLLRSISSQPVKPREIIVVDDDSTDHTADVARQFGAKVIPAQPLPEGWRGKTWACHLGAQAATGELLMFLDADTWFEPEGLARTLAAFVAQPRRCVTDRQTNHTLKCEKQTLQTGPNSSFVGAFSVGPYHAVTKPYEQLSLFFNLAMTVGTVPNRLFGQTLLVDRQSYQQVGGHKSVKGKILENYFLADRFRAAGIAVRSWTGRGILAFRMYPNGPRELIEGWTKSFSAGAGRAPRGVLLLVIAWMIGLMLAHIGWFLTFKHETWGVLYLVYAAQVMWFGRQLGSFSPLTALLYPVPLLFFFIVFARAVLQSGKPVSWKGRKIRAD